MSSVLAEKRIETIQMQTEAQVVFNGERVVKIEIIPTGRDMQEFDACEDIADRLFDPHAKKDFHVAGGELVIACGDEIFLFPLCCAESDSEAVSKQVVFGKFFTAKERPGFSLNIGA